MSTLPAFASSGDLLADRRYAYAKGALDAGDPVAAADLARQALELAPRFAAGCALLGRALTALGQTQAAAAALSEALALQPDDTLGVGIDLAHLGVLHPEGAITRAHVRALFDDYAPRFERHLVKNLGYRGPELLADALRSCAVRRLRSTRFGRAFDLGCGTGLMAQALADACDAIEGVDLSPRMLAQAKKTHRYAGLHVGDLIDFLATRAEGEADLVVACDVFVYMAALGAVFRQVHRVLARGGFFAFTVQAHEGVGVVLGADARYAHGEGCLRDLAAETGFAIVTFERVSTRQDRGEDVPGFLVVLER